MALTINDIQTANPKNKGILQNLAQYLLGEVVGYDEQGNMLDPNKKYDAQNILKDFNAQITKGADEDVMKKAATSMMNEGARIQPFLGEGVNYGKVPIKDWAKLTGTAALKHPFKTAGLIGLGAGNLGGLTDNDKFGGQLGGLALGGLGASALATNPYVAAMMTMGGGALGSLFDKLRARKEQEQAQPYYTGR